MERLALLAFPAIDPVLWSFGPFSLGGLTFGPFDIRWYGLAYVTGFVFAIWYMRRIVSTPALWPGARPSLTPTQVDDLFLWMVAGVVLGGRLGFVLFYEPLFYVQNPSAILTVWRGGMSFHGGFLGVIIAAFFYGRRNHVRLDQLLDLGAASVPVGLGLGRMANFINAELYGRAADVPWAMVFPTDPAQLSRHPTQLYEAVLEGLVLFIAVWIAIYRYKVLVRPGFAAGIFALGYGLARISVEFFREPDANLGFFAGYFTMGMMLSVPMLAVGMWLIWRARHNPPIHDAAGT